MKALALAILLASCATAGAASLEADYLAARDRDIAALAKIENAPDRTKGDAQLERDLADLQTRMQPIIGRVAVAGFAAEGKLNLDSLFAHDEGFMMLDGLVYGDHESDKSLVITTPGLLDAWLAAHAGTDKGDPDVPRDPAQAVKTEIFYTWALSTDSAAVHYAEIPFVAPAGATFAQATLSARTQDQSPRAPDKLFVALGLGDRIFVVEEKLATPMKPIAACDALAADTEKQAEATDKAYVPSKDPAETDPGAAMRDKGDAAFRACYGAKVKASRAFKAATAQATAIVAALVAARRD